MATTQTLEAMVTTTDYRTAEQAHEQGTALVIADNAKVVLLLHPNGTKELRITTATGLTTSVDCSDTLTRTYEAEEA